MATPDLALLEIAYRKLTPDLSEFACSYDLDGNIIEINGAWERISGYSRAEALGKNLSELLDPQSWERSREQIREQLGGGSPQSLKVNLVTKGGQYIPLEGVRRLLFEQGRPVAVLDSGHPAPLSDFSRDQNALHDAE